MPGTWLFSYSDALIRLFPVEFWFDATVMLAIIGFVGGLALALGGWQIQLKASQAPEQALAAG